MMQVYAREDMLQAEYDLLSETKLIEFAAEIYKQLHNTDDLPQGTINCL